MQLAHPNTYISFYIPGDSSFCQILYDHTTYPSAPPSPPGPQSPEVPLVLPSLCPEVAPALPSGVPEPSPAIAKAKEFVADIFRRAKEAKGGTSEDARPLSYMGPSGSCCRPSSEPVAPGGEVAPQDSPPAAEEPAPEPGYVNYTKLYYVLGSGEGTEPEDGEQGVHPAGPRTWEAGLGGQTSHRPTPSSCPSEFEDDKISLPFVVTDLRGRSLRPMRERASVQVSAGSRQNKGQPQGACSGSTGHSPPSTPPPTAHRVST